MPPETEQSQPAKYESPKPLAEIVQWAPTPAGPFLPAIVTLQGDSTISVAVISPESRAVAPKEAVRYVDDPGFRQLLDSSGGVWRHARIDVSNSILYRKHSDLADMVVQALGQIAELRREITALTTALGAEPAIPQG